MALLRFTPPTCTLEITGKRSPLSRWASRPVLKELQFELSFDAPQLSEEQQVKIWGNQEQLDALCDSVTMYVQEFLQQTPPDPVRELPSKRSQTYSPPPADLDKPQAPSQDSSLMPMARSIAPQELSIPSSLAPLQSASVAAEPSESARVESQGIYLQPNGLLSHHLFLGSLSTPDSGPVIHLGALQLFDLASALDEYRAELLGLPTLSYSQEKGVVTYFKKPAAWGNIAALLLLTAGTATVLTQYYYQQQPSLETANSQVESTNQPQQPVAVVPPTPQPNIAVTPTPIPKVSVPPTPTQGLPTLPPGATGTPKPTLPSLPSGAVPAQPNPLPTQPNNLQIPGQSSAGVGNNSQQSIGIPPTGLGTSRSADSSIPPIRFPDIKTPAPPDISDIQVPPPAPTMNPSVPPSTPATPPAVVTIPRGNEPPPLLPDVQLPDNFNTASGNVAAGTPEGTQESLSQDSAVAKVSPGTRSAAEPVESEAQDTQVSAASQVNQAQDYFQQRWKPRPEVTQPLEYTLSLNPDGSVKQITPRGLNAQRLIEVTGMPQMNQPFVSPVQQGQEPPRIRVVFKPDGSVQTFEEPFKEGF